MKRAFIVAAAIFTIGAGATGAIYGPDQYRIYKAKQAVRELLRDPDSATFTQVAVSTKAICGMVNSRNGYGAMAGPVPFMAVNDQPAELAPVEFFHDDSDLERARDTVRDMQDLSNNARRIAMDNYERMASERIKFEEWRLRTFTECRDDLAPAPNGKK